MPVRRANVPGMTEQVGAAHSVMYMPLAGAQNDCHGRRFDDRCLHQRIAEPDPANPCKLKY
jgi:hypothetical protein